MWIFIKPGFPSESFGGFLLYKPHPCRPHINSDIEDIPLIHRQYVWGSERVPVSCPSASPGLEIP